MPAHDVPEVIVRLRTKPVIRITAAKPGRAGPTESTVRSAPPG